jgi:hypothetical protein
LSVTNTLFTLSMVVALVYDSFNQTVKSIECFIIMSMLMGYLCSVWSVKGFRLVTPVVGELEDKSSDQVFLKRIWHVLRSWAFEKLGVASTSLWFTGGSALSFGTHHCYGCIWCVALFRWH